MKYLDELEKLNLPKDKFAIFSSGYLAIRNIRENNDLDIIIKEDLWQELKKKYPLNEKGHLGVGNIEIAREIIHLNNVDKLIDNAEIIDGFRFVRLDDIIKWKKLMNREKDVKDLKLIEEYLKNKNGHL